MARLDLVAIKKVAKRYGSERALAGVSLEFRGGSMTALLGHNGAGKTTLLGVVSTLVRPSQGAVSYRAGGQELSGEAVRAGLAQDEALRALTVTPARLLGESARLGRIAPGQLANLVIADADLFVNDDAHIYETWVEGERFERVPLTGDKAPGRWAMRWADGQGPSQLIIRGDGDVLDVTALLDSLLGEQASAETAASHLRATVEDGNTTVSVQTGADTWKDVVVLQNHDTAIKVLFDDKHAVVTPHD